MNVPLSTKLSLSSSSVQDSTSSLAGQSRPLAPHRIPHSVDEIVTIIKGSGAFEKMKENAIAMMRENKCNECIEWKAKRIVQERNLVQRIYEEQKAIHNNPATIFQSLHREISRQLGRNAELGQFIDKSIDRILLTGNSHNPNNAGIKHIIHKYIHQTINGKTSLDDSEDDVTPSWETEENQSEEYYDDQPNNSLNPEIKEEEKSDQEHNHLSQPLHSPSPPLSTSIELDESKSDNQESKAQISEKSPTASETQINLNSAPQNTQETNDRIKDENSNTENENRIKKEQTNIGLPNLEIISGKFGELGNESSEMEDESDDDEILFPTDNEEDEKNGHEDKKIITKENQQQEDQKEEKPGPPKNHSQKRKNQEKSSGQTSRLNKEKDSPLELLATVSNDRKYDEDTDNSDSSFSDSDDELLMQDEKAEVGTKRKFSSTSLNHFSSVPPKRRKYY